MFRSIRNKRNEISTDEVKELLRSSRRGILAVNGDDGYPYAIPINYLYDEDAHKIVFHGAKAGYKVDCLKVCDKVCFTVYGALLYMVMNAFRKNRGHHFFKVRLSLDAAT